jgi:hypothetical protein
LLIYTLPGIVIEKMSTGQYVNTEVSFPTLLSFQGLVEIDVENEIIVRVAAGGNTFGNKHGEYQGRTASYPFHDPKTQWPARGMPIPALLKPDMFVNAIIGSSAGNRDSGYGNHRHR